LFIFFPIVHFFFFLKKKILKEGAKMSIDEHKVERDQEFFAFKGSGQRLNAKASKKADEIASASSDKR